MIKKGKYRRANQFRLSLHFSENSGQSTHQLALVLKVSVMRAVLTGVLPKSFRGIQLGRILGQRLDFQPVSIGLQQALHQRLLVIGGVVVNENRALPPIASGQGLQKGQVGFGIEYAVLLIMKPYLPQLDGAQDLDALAFVRSRESPVNVRRGSRWRAGWNPGGSWLHRSEER